MLQTDIRSTTDAEPNDASTPNPPSAQSNGPGWIGEPGEQIATEGRVEMTRVFGSEIFFKIKDESGRILVGGSTSENAWDIHHVRCNHGRYRPVRVRLSGAVLRHDHYRGEAQTRIDAPRLDLIRI